MPERELFWSAPPEWEAAEILRPGLRAVARRGLGHLLVSGNLEAAYRALAREAPEVGLWSVVEAETYWVRIARDRALLVSASSAPAESGWRPEGFAASPADDAWTVLELDGEGLRVLISEAVAADIDAGSRSAAITFAGVPALLYRTAAQRARLHVERSLAPYVWRWLETRPG